MSTGVQATNAPAAAGSLPGKESQQATAFDAVQTTPAADEVAACEQNIKRLEQARDALLAQVDEAANHIKRVAEVGDLTRLPKAQREMDACRKAVRGIEDQIKDAQGDLRAARRRAGLLASEVWIQVTSLDKFFRILPDGRGLGPAHSQDGWKAATQIEVADGPEMEKRIVESIRPVFGCDEPFAMLDGALVYNTYRSPAVEAKPGSCKGVINVMLNLAGGERRHLLYLLRWSATPVQEIKKHRRSRRTNVAVALVGAPGTGKDLYFRVMAQMYGPGNTRMLAQEDVDSRFTTGVADKLFVMINEAQSNAGVWNTTTANKLKLWVTDRYIREEMKGRDAVLRERHFNCVIASNEDLFARIDKGDRRFVVLKSETKIAVDDRKQVLDPDIRALIAELEALEDWQARGCQGPAPVAPQIAAFRWLLENMPEAKLLKTGEIIETDAKRETIQQFAMSEDEFATLIEECGLKALVEEYRKRHPPRKQLARDGDRMVVVDEEPTIFDEGELYVEHSAYKGFVEPRRLHGLYVEWHSWSRRKDRVVPCAAFVAKMRARFGGTEHQIRQKLGGVARPRVLTKVPLAIEVPAEPEEPMVRQSDDADFSCAAA